MEPLKSLDIQEQLNHFQNQLILQANQIQSLAQEKNLIQELLNQTITRLDSVTVQYQTAQAQLLQLNSIIQFHQNSFNVQNVNAIQEFQRRASALPPPVMNSKEPISSNQLKTNPSVQVSSSSLSGGQEVLPMPNPQKVLNATEKGSLWSEVVKKNKASKKSVVCPVPSREESASVTKSTESKSDVPKVRSDTHSQKKGSVKRPQSLQNRMENLSTEEKEKLLYNKKLSEADMTTAVWSAVLRFPFNSQAMGERIFAMKTAILCATGQAPLNVGAISPNMGTIYFDEKIHPQEQTMKILRDSQARFKLVDYHLTVKDVKRLAHSYLNQGYFKVLRRAILPLQDKQLITLVLNQVEELIPTMPQLIRHRHRKTVEWDRKELLSEVVPNEMMGGLDEDNLMMDPEI